MCPQTKNRARWDATRSESNSAQLILCTTRGLKVGKKRFMLASVATSGPLAKPYTGASTTACCYSSSQEGIWS